MIHNGIDNLHSYLSLFQGKRLGLLTNACATDNQGHRTVDAIRSLGLTITQLFSPEHGLNGTADAGAHVDDSTDAATGLPCLSLFGSHIHIPKELFQSIDILLADLPDVGVRYYTYPSTVFSVMEDCATARCPLWILDRANPLGNKKEGPVLKKEFSSIVGTYPVEVRHGMTIGEYASRAQKEFGLAPACMLSVIPTNAAPDAMFPDFGLPWINPSPNLRSFEALCAYPGICLFEGTNISEGRGTDAPFLKIGAPFINARQLLNSLPVFSGCTLCAVDFTPDASKFQGKYCHGLQLCITDYHAFNGYETGFQILDAIRRLYPDNLTFLIDHFNHLMGSDDYLKQTTQAIN